MRRILLVSFALLLAACTGTLPAPPASDTATISPVPGGAEGTVSPEETSRLDAYEAVVRHLLGTERTGWNEIYVQKRICRSADSVLRQRACHQRLSPEDQLALAGRLVDLGARVSFVKDFAASGHGRHPGVFVWMGPVAHGPGDTLEVAGSMSCGGLCGTGSTWKLVPTGTGWKVRGPAGGAGVWIA